MIRSTGARADLRDNKIRCERSHRLARRADQIRGDHHAQVHHLLRNRRCFDQLRRNIGRHRGDPVAIWCTDRERPSPDDREGRRSHGSPGSYAPARIVIVPKPRWLGLGPDPETRHADPYFPTVTPSRAPAHRPPPRQCRFLPRARICLCVRARGYPPHASSREGMGYEHLLEDNPLVLYDSYDLPD